MTKLETVKTAWSLLVDGFCDDLPDGCGCECCDLRETDGRDCAVFKIRKALDKGAERIVP
jgi:hypothetical protein